jgi:uncharacterized damage-inducible protein DinB
MAEQTLVELLYGKGAHANTLACVEDISLELAGWRIENFPHSIWQLLSHMNYWMSYELRRIRGEAPAYPEHAAESWPADVAPASEQEWRNAVTLFKNLLVELTALAESSSEVLAQQVSATYPGHTKYSSSLLAVLWQILVHNSYHIGQVAMLRRALGAWPPQGGGDSW